MAQVMLVGPDAALLEGLAQSLARVGHSSSVAASLGEARELASASPPLVLVADRLMASSAGGELLSVPIAPGGARVLYRSASGQSIALLPFLQRAVLADLTLPLERHRLSALVQSISDRAVTTGRASRPISTESSPDT